MASALCASLMYRCEPKVARACLHRNFIFVLSSKDDYRNSMQAYDEKILAQGNSCEYNDYVLILECGKAFK